MSGAFFFGVSMSKVIFEDFDKNTHTHTRVHEEDGKTVFEKTYDAEPFLKAAEANRQFTAGQSWGDGRKVGTIPMAVLGTFLRQDGGLDVKRLTQWLRENPAFVSYEPFLKVKVKM
jgi:hypothetical protein